ncbi:Kef-type K+ transport system membrane component KefB [Caldanaerobacter subterraneus subsp. tengcongensis MB4]|uniref:Kef-type K+ transport systems, membrane components n=1 Tax=Caldanaerobacter subterraneus subsp. tengcongensis (strain DSM 15242 / JCM 11007 / NBRC 100824 / MB4) TaxID=273068 RepID=Q8R8U0_CALS4|nr:cation:proton antiporter [Caldanaerobacter subterraneus]AAM25084.1 Kef-type K+ transport systems, membrane components [Caldanaerobacter subterraneus subsp. tengcongensis MB4]MCS3915328.1 Kef-type K+ transport system membrane component KefB [Caldanaerobacter subterraneus subsp. tengcongensis MB4]
MWLTYSWWLGLALIAGIIANWTGISISLIEILVGVIAGNYLGFQTNDWINFLGGVGSILLTFLAGAEVDPIVLRTKFKESVTIGVLAFVLPFAGAFAYTYFVAGWTLQAAEIAGIALSTTSVAVVYAVMVESGLNESELGKIILAACFINDLGTVLMLGILFASYNKWMLLFIIVTTIVIVLMPSVTKKFFEIYGNKVGQLEIKYLLFFVFLTGGLASMANSEAVLPAYILGLAVSGFFMKEKNLLFRLRAVTFAVFTPFYFLKAGLFVSIPGVISNIYLIVILLLIKMFTKYIGVKPATMLFRFSKKEGMYTTLLMSTGLTFGTISAMFGLNHKIITVEQYTILVTVVILSAIVPTLIAEKFYRPERED